MKKFGKILLIGLGFGLVVIALGFFTSPPAPAQNSVPVTVVNTPLPVKGTVNANITNTPVPVTGTVNVNIANPPLQPLLASDTVTLSASSLASAPCGNAAFEMFTFDNFVVKNSGVLQPFTLPAGKVLVVTSFDWVAYSSPPNLARTAYLNPATSFGFNAAEAQSTAIADSNGKAGGSETFPTGIVLQNPGNLCLHLEPKVTGEVVSGVINGFLAPDR